MGPGQGHAILAIDGNRAAASQLDPACEAPVYNGPPKTGPVSFFLALRRQIRQIAPRVLITYNWGAMDAVLAARLAGTPPVIHNECGFSNEYDGLKRRRAWFRRLLLNGVHTNVVVAESLRQMMLGRFGVRPDKVRLIKTGVDVERFHPWRNEALRRQFSPEAGGLVYGYMGGLRASKNVPALIRAYAALNRPADRLVLFGEGPLKAELEALARSLGVERGVVFHGHTKDVAAAYAAVDVYATASRSEAASNSLLEAMATGLPAVVSDIADNKLLLSEPNRRFVHDPLDVEAYVRSFRSLAADGRLRAELGRCNRRRAEQEYPLERMFREYIELWESAAYD